MCQTSTLLKKGKKKERINFNISFESYKIYKSVDFNKTGNHGNVTVSVCNDDIYQLKL